MENYISHTGDVQTIALVFSSLPRKLYEDDRASVWIDM